TYIRQPSIYPSLGCGTMGFLATEARACPMSRFLGRTTAMTGSVAKLNNLTIPVIAAPLFLVSGPDLVINCCKEGVVGTFPSLNLRSAAGFEEWLIRIKSELAAHDAANPRRPAAPFGVNIIAHKTNLRLEEDMALVEK